MSDLIPKREKFRPTPLNFEDYPLIQDYNTENKKIENHDHMLIAYENNNKKIYWTSLQGISKNIQTITQPTIVINLSQYKNNYQCNKNVECVNIEITDSVFGKTILDILKEFSKILYYFKKWYMGEYVDIIIHCFQGQHRSFSLAALLSLFIINKNTGIKLTLDDYIKYTQKLIEKYNNYELTPTIIDEEHFDKLFNIFKIEFNNI